MIKTTRFASVVLFLTGIALTQNSQHFDNPSIQDPGVQAASRGTGGPIIPLASAFYPFFVDGHDRFQNVQVIPGGSGAAGGLGPRFNSNQCSSCHAQPAVGGTGAAMNPQFAFAGSPVAPSNTTPPFVTATGPTLEARFPFFFNNNNLGFNPRNGGLPYGGANFASPNGGVEELFTVAGRTDAGTCTLAQPNFAAAIAANNIIFRIPTPLFGAGLVENLDESTLLANHAINLANNFGIAGSFNRNGNDGTITRFGWKAQNKSLLLFAGEAYNVEMGVSNEILTQDRPLPGEEHAAGLPANCLNLAGVGYPEDTFNPTATAPSQPGGTQQSAVLSDIEAFANFMRFLAPPPSGGVVLNGTPVPAATITTGKVAFEAIGCSTCHNLTITSATQVSTIASSFDPSLGNTSVNGIGSDLEIHHMGAQLADNVSQGNAGGDQFRTAPLWGVGQRIFLLHDGRTTNLVVAIQNHAGWGSEANFVVQQFFQLTPTQQQDILDFLRSL